MLINGCSPTECGEHPHKYVTQSAEKVEMSIKSVVT